MMPPYEGGPSVSMKLLLREPLLHFFIERYAESYRRQVDAFADAVERGGRTSPTFEDGRRALILANAAGESLRSGQSVKVSY